MQHCDITCLSLNKPSFYNYYVTPLGGGPHVSVIASTMGSSLIRYTIEVPIKDLRYTGQNRAFPAGKHAQRLMRETCLLSLLIWFDEFFLCVSGKDYALVHAAPIVAVFVLDHDMQPLPSPSELEAKAFPGKPCLLTTPTLYDRHRPKHGPSTLPCDSNTGTNKGERERYIYIYLYTAKLLSI